MSSPSLAVRRIATRRCVLARGRSYATPATFTKKEADPLLNGYPELPYVSRQYLQPYGWDDPQMRRNFGEPLHEQEEILSMWGPDIPVVPPYTALLHFTIATLGFVGFGFLTKAVLVADRPAVPREYPYSGLVTELGGLEENKARTEEAENGEE